MRGHALMIHDYANGRKFTPPERFIFAAAARDARVATAFDRFGARQIGPARTLATAMPLAAWANVRHALSARRSRPEPADATVRSAN
jgi:hypothetical protein